ncbi:MAG: EpsG family protein [Thomasclavelia sp.]
MIYYLVIATFLFFGFFSKHSKKYYFISLLLLFFFTGFRDITLGDYNNDAYINAFNIVDTLSNFSFLADYPFEMGFMLLISICKTIINDFRFFQVIYTLIVIILLHLVINKMEITYKQRCLFLFVYFCMRFVINNFIILRQNLALLIIWNLLLTDTLPFKSAIKNKFIPYIISCYFHITSIINIFCLFLKNKLALLNKRSTYVITIIISLFFLFSGTRLFQPIMNFMIQIGGEKFESYIGSETNTFNIIYYIIRIVIFTFLFIFYSQFKYKKKSTLFVINMLAILFGSINVAIFSRFMEYLMVGPYLTIALLEEIFEYKNKKEFLIILYIIMIIILVRSLLTYDSGTLFIPYRLFH